MTRAAEEGVPTEATEAETLPGPSGLQLAYRTLSGGSLAIVALHGPDPQVAIDLLDTVAVSDSGSEVTLGNHQLVAGPTSSAFFNLEANFIADTPGFAISLSDPTDPPGAGNIVVSSQALPDDYWEVLAWFAEADPGQDEITGEWSFIAGGDIELAGEPPII